VESLIGLGRNMHLKTTGRRSETCRPEIVTHSDSEVRGELPPPQLEANTQTTIISPATIDVFLISGSLRLSIPPNGPIVNLPALYAT
jgi:hypothetical protein